MVAGRDSKRAPADSLEWLGVLLIVALLHLTVTSPLLGDGIVHHDAKRAGDYYLVTWKMLLQHGVAPWWRPDAQFGYPNYFNALFGAINGKSPLYLATGLLFFLGHYAGIRLSDPQLIGVYIVYYSLVVNAAIVAASYVFARFLFAASATRLFFTLLVAFSPPVFFQITDPGLAEPLVYGMLFCAAVLAFLKRPARQRFWAATAAAGVVTVSLGYASLLAAIVLLPVFAVVVLSVERSRRRLLAGLAAQNRLDLALAALLLALCLLPALTLAGESALFQREFVSVVSYSNFLRNPYFGPGNLMEVLSVGIPIGKDWALYKVFVSELVIPLALLGLLKGPRLYRIPLLVTAVILPLTVIAVNASPLMLVLLEHVSILAKNSHFGDAFFRAGGVMPLLIAAAAGFDTLMKNGRAHRRLFMIALAAWSSAALALDLWWHPRLLHELGTRSESVLPVFLTFVPTYLIIAYNASPRSLRRRRMINPWALTFIGALAIELSIFGFWHVTRTLIQDAKLTSAYDQPAESFGDYSTGLIAPLSTLGIRDEVSRQSMPRFAFYTCATAASGSDAEVVGRAVGAQRTLLVDDALARSLPRGICVQGNPPASHLRGWWATPTRLVLQAEVSAPGVLFIRNVYWPGWTARVNGEPVTIHHALRSYQAIALPRGASDVELLYSHPTLPWLLLLAYGGLFAAVWRALQLSTISLRPMTWPAFGVACAICLLPPLAAAAGLTRDRADVATSIERGWEPKISLGGETFLVHSTTDETSPLSGMVDLWQTTAEHLIIKGWAADLVDAVPAQRVAVLVNGRFHEWLPMTGARPGLVTGKRTEGLRQSGFQFEMRLDALRAQQVKTISFVAVDRRHNAMGLATVSGYPY